MNHSKFIIHFIIFTILIKFSTLAYKNAHSTFSAVKNITKIKNSPKHCSCHKKEALSKMTAVEFRDGYKYLISTDPIGKGGTALVFHAIYFGQNWEMAVKSKTNCVAIKVANTNTNRNNNDRIANELEILNNIFQPNEEYSLWPKLSYNLNFLRSEIYSSIDESIHFAIVMELGKLNLYEYWQNALAKIWSKRYIFDTVLETILLSIMREISLGLHELHERNYIFIDLKPQNVMIMPNSPDPKELNDGNYGRLQIKLIDFGSALKIVPDEDGNQKSSDNETKNLMCSKFYLAPEIYKPINNKISPGTDIFSLGRLMLMLAVQTPQMKKFIPQIKQFWEEVNHRKNSEESHKNWAILLDEMLRVAGIHPTIILPSNVEELSESENEYEIFEHESQRSNLEEISDHENEVFDGKEISEHGYEYENSEDESEWNLEKIYNKILERERKEKEEQKRKKEIEERNEFFKTLFEELKMNYGHLIKIIEQTQATDQEKRPSISSIIKECSQKLVHLGRIQTERKMHKNPTARKLFFSGVLTTGSSERTDSSGSSSSKGSSSKNSKRSRRRWSMDSIRF